MKKNTKTEVLSPPKLSPAQIRILQRLERGAEICGGDGSNWWWRAQTTKPPLNPKSAMRLRDLGYIGQHSSLGHCYSYRISPSGSQALRGVGQGQYRRELEKVIGYSAGNGR